MRICKLRRCIPRHNLFKNYSTCAQFVARAEHRYQYLSQLRSSAFYQRVEGKSSRISAAGRKKKIANSNIREIKKWRISSILSVSTITNLLIGLKDHRLKTSLRISRIGRVIKHWIQTIRQENSLLSYTDCSKKHEFS